MPKFVDRSGQVFGRLRVIKDVGRNNLNKVMWKCACECGNTVVVTSGSLVTGNTLSCGCYLKERITKHGGTGRQSYRTWHSMIRRCTISTDKDYPRYGGAGVSVCHEWMDYTRFVNDMGEPGPKETLDRIDPYGNYTKENCRWASKTVQARNVRVRKNSKSGHTGVLPVPHCPGKWFAAIQLREKRFYSRVTTSIEEAVIFRKELEQKYWGVVK
jgi:hypothetical protein